MIPTKKKTPEELAALRDALAFPESFAEPAPEPQPDPDESAEQDLTNSGDQTPTFRKKRNHTLRKVELPLFPAQPVTSKTSLPQRRRSIQEIKKIQSQEVMVTPENHPNHPILQIKKLTAHPLLLTPTYLIAFTAVLAVWKRAYFITPISLLCVSGLLSVYIFWKKKRSRHHAAILMIILAMTLIFGAILYAPFLKPYLAPYFSYAT
jgi:hypothetical protein